jgi:16S rRNA (guanine527-N7)-methyltransferase
VIASGPSTERADPAVPGGPDRLPFATAELAAAAAEAGLDDGQIRALSRFRDLLLAWNERFNLTAVREAAAVERRLLLDALRMLPALDAAVAGAGVAVPRVVDIGSGGGLPAVPIAICRPGVRVTMVEATGKKVAFLREAVRDLGLANATAIHARAEEIARDLDHRAAYEIATARAVASLPALVELTMPLLRPRGVALLPKGLDLDDEIRAGEAAAREVGAEIRSAEVLPGGESRLVVVRKLRPTPERFPRRAGMPAREPLGGGVRSGASPGGRPR